MITKKSQFSWNFLYSLWHATNILTKNACQHLKNVELNLQTKDNYNFYKPPNEDIIYKFGCQQASFSFFLSWPDRKLLPKTVTAKTSIKWTYNKHTILLVFQTTSVNFANILCVAFSCNSFGRNFFCTYILVRTFLVQEYWHKCWWY